mmetsp:Transcript_95828/g.310565  ORF Transcript_95828/g.310565 Transcript_95828/m.310565 type:complete len:239 (+) Transcript_95828:183-899(+)
MPPADDGVGGFGGAARETATRWGLADSPHEAAEPVPLPPGPPSWYEEPRMETGKVDGSAHSGVVIPRCLEPFGQQLPAVGDAIDGGGKSEPNPCIVPEDILERPARLSCTPKFPSCSVTHSTLDSTAVIDFRAVLSRTSEVFPRMAFPSLSFTWLTAAPTASTLRSAAHVVVSTAELTLCRAAPSAVSHQPSVCACATVESAAFLARPARLPTRPTVDHKPVDIFEPTPDKKSSFSSR